MAQSPKGGFIWTPLYKTSWGLCHLLSIHCYLICLNLFTVSPRCHGRSGFRHSKRWPNRCQAKRPSGIFECANHQGTLDTNHKKYPIHHNPSKANQTGWPGWPGLPVDRPVLATLLEGQGQIGAVPDEGAYRCHIKLGQRWNLV